ncbi:NUDIX domain-containing protein [Thermanaerosceptrum fracticalcis]|uniref:NUDIX domain-containing protein n=1 Tax=Thermanaerosceptrum fracticalcis TaxID=1712410 RepID=A0A7G6E2C2_THEFR|nr:NUDIX domain-containing protein [Thermanaerosceptrum fracticalcis]QNB46226.1 NUDIX domain-containing protein [Thermanaerosceptrum fracticalcis]
MKPGVAVGVLVIEKGKVLLGKRHPDLVGGGYWCVPMGRLEYGEAIRECGLRELEEESGLTAREIRVLSVHNVILPTSHYLTFSLLAHGISGEPQVKSPLEITEWAWFSLDQLPQPLFYPIKEMITVYHRQHSLIDGVVLEHRWG